MKLRQTFSKIFRCGLLGLLLMPVGGQPALAETIAERLNRTLREAVGPPGENFGEKSNFVAVNSDGDVTFAFLCSAGKEDGYGDKGVELIFTALNNATKGIPTLFAAQVKNAIAIALVNKGDAFCGALAFKKGTKERAKNISDGSIYTTSWRSGTKVKTETDTSACQKLSKRYLCYEVASAPFFGGQEIDGVSGCFEAKIDGTLVSYSFGRGDDLPADVKASFKPGQSKSSDSCSARGFD